MKRVMLTLSGLFLAVNLCMAQSWQLWETRHQRGMATQQMRADGLSAAHSSLPLGSKVKVINLANGLEIEVTIVSHIPESNNRIIDLSSSAARALDLITTGPVLVTPLNQSLPSASGAPPLPAPSPSPVSAPATATESRTEIKTEVDGDKQPYNLTINNYIINPDNQILPLEEWPGSEKERPTRQFRALPASEPSDVELLPPPPPPPPPPEPPPEPVAAPPAQSSLYTSPPVANIQIIPGLPDPHTGKIYRLLVGSYPGVDSAYLIYRQLAAAGFSVIQEQAGDMCRVFAAGIPASRVWYAAQRLGAIGFAQVWVQE